MVKLVLCSFLIIHLAACGPLLDKNRSPDVAHGTYGAQVGIVNHTEKYIYSTHVGDGGGGHASAYSNGVANMCCVTVPDKWYPGLSLKVSWDMPINGIHSYKNKIVDVEKYDEPGSVYLHFFFRRSGESSGNKMGWWFTTASDPTCGEACIIEPRKIGDN